MVELKLSVMLDKPYTAAVMLLSIKSGTQILTFFSIAIVYSIKSCVVIAREGEVLEWEEDLSTLNEVALFHFGIKISENCRVLPVGYQL